MKKSIFLTIFSLCAFTVTAQHQLSGTVKDAADGEPLPYATAALLRPDSTVVTGVMTGNDGKFVIERVAEGVYLLQISFIGYQKQYLTVNVPAQSDLGEITLSESATRLQEVVINASRALVEQKLDRIVVNVSGNMITSGLNVNDVLKRLPGLIVDKDGNVKLNGRDATVYIDGRPTRLPAEQVAQLLSGMMGEVVDRVELITNPSSRYEAGMSAAIVNIRLKRNASLGVNGTVRVGVGFTDYDFTTRDGLNLNFRSKKLNIFGNYGYNKTPKYFQIWQKRDYDGTPPVTYDQYSLSRPVDESHTLRAGVDGFISPKQTVGFLFTGTFKDSDGAFASKADITRTGVAKTDSTVLSDSPFTNKYSSQMYNLNYRLSISDSEEITVDADYGRVYARRWQNIKSSYFDSDGSEQRLPTEFQYNGPRNIDIFSLKADYEKAFSEKSRMEAGVKTGKTVTDNDILYENRYNGEWVNDRNQSNEFKYTEAVSAGYATYSHGFGKFSAMVGLRAEYTSVKGESPTMDTTFTRGYLGWFPSAYLQYRLNDRQGLNLSYSRKINRPGYSLLNPFRTYVDPFTFGSGNPDLQPEYSNTVALRYNIGSYSVNASYSVVNDVFEKEFIQDNANHIFQITQNNIGKRQNFIVSGFAPVQIAKWYTLRIYAQTAWNVVDVRYNGEPLKKDYFDAYTRLYQEFTILPTLKADIQMMWMSSSWSGLIARLDGFWSMDASIEKTFFDGRLSLSLWSDDIFGTAIWKGKINYGNIHQTFKEHYRSRVTMLSMRYSFGSQQIRGARNRRVGIEDEMGRTQ